MSEDARRYYDELAHGEWDRLEKDLHGRVKYRIHRAFLLRHVPPGARVLDAGCGPGRFAIDLIRAGAKVTLLDLSPVQLDLARERIAAAGLSSGVEGDFEGDVADLSAFPDATFDAVLCFGGALSYARERAADAVGEFRRVLRPGGLLVASVMGIYGALRLGAVLDPPETIARLETHLDWPRPDTLPEVVASAPGSAEWHVPLTLYTSRSLRALLEAGGFEVTETATANPLSVRSLLQRTGENPEACERWIELELQAATRPELLDAGEHLLAAGVARALADPESRTVPRAQG
jgi:SAM-dependent methyltransferase